MAAPQIARHENIDAPPAIRVLGATIESYLPDTKQPPWRRALFVLLSGLAMFVILPNPVVVSDVSHTLIGFEIFPEKHRQFRAADNTPAVWIVEETPAHELYSNGLRIETSLAVRNTQRFYQVMDRGASFDPGTEWFSNPAGIIFHTSESPQAPFEAEQNHTIQRLGKALLNHVVTNRSYNYVVDRFGRVHRIVEELDAPHHAGNSVWALGRSVYVNLNNSFLGVSFESAGEASLTTAQIFSGRLLTQMLRNKYKLPIENCITHAQVSVNPSNMRVGYHTDGARGFPFVEMGLANNYDLPVAAIADFGFTYDGAFEQAMGSRTWKGLTRAEHILNEQAAASRVSLDEHRAALQARYRRVYAAIKDAGTATKAVEGGS